MPISERVMKRFLLLPALMFRLSPLLAADAGEVASLSPPPGGPGDSLAAEIAAAVGSVRIRADQVFELWTPVWYETLAKVRNGKLDPEKGDDRLSREWRRALKALIKDEVFYQEAEYEFNSDINGIVDNIVRQGDPRPRGRIASEIKRRLNQDMDRYFRQLNSELVRESGGGLKLRKVLEDRGVTFLEWRNRLRKKAFTQSYLRQIINPRAPDPGPRRIQEYYARHPEEFSLPGLVRFQHIFFSNAERGGADSAREAAIGVWQDLEEGKIDFETAVREFSDDPISRERGGRETGEEAGDPEREAWLSDVRTALREEEPGALAPILESPFGCHLAKLVSIGAERRIPFGEASRDIEGRLKSEIWEEETDRYYNSIRRNIDVRVLMPDFPPHLSCAAQAAMNSESPRVYNTGWPGMRAFDSLGP
ncbi:MAG: peptidyl-prolyl cis-trans isomerase [Planctomycetota bacterium]|jgi:parvulin-like peptidyl-prolyl isomerase|nr:peptidyl-prolyl cis-trans isomerase [Planctomycetota bacterium]